MIDKKLLFIDLETTGRDYKSHDIVEMAFIVVQGKKVIKECCYRVRPFQIEKNIVTFYNQLNRSITFEAKELVPVQLSSKNVKILHIVAENLVGLEHFKICNSLGGFVHEINGRESKIEQKKGYRKVDYEALRINGMTEEGIIKFDTPKKVAKLIKSEVMDEFKDCPIIPCGHNIINFDLLFLYEWIAKVGEFGLERLVSRKAIIDTYNLALYLKALGIITIQSLSLDKLCKHYGIINNSQHSALGDARANVELYLKLESLLLDYSLKNNSVQLSIF